MRILHINSYFSTSGLFKQLYQRQEAVGLDLNVYVPIAHEYDMEKLAASGSYTDVVKNFHQWERVIFPMKHHHILKDLVGRYNFENFDLVHAHSLFSNGWLAYQLKQRFGLPYMVAVRSADIATFFGKMPWMRATGIRILQNAEKIIFISQNNYNEVFEKYIPKHKLDDIQAKSQVLANGIDDFWHQNAPSQAKEAPHHPLRMVSTGKIMKRKRYENLVARLDIFQKNHQEKLELHLVGPEWEKGLLDKLTAYPFVHYHPAMSKEELANFYADMDVFILLSYPETFGLVYAEAMSQGLPIIYTKGQGFDSFFSNHLVGESVDPHDQDQLDQAIGYIQDHYTTMSAAALANIHYFDWNKINQEYLSIYRMMLDKQ